jgi:hypothetical protein
MDRREFLTGSMGALLLAPLPADLFAHTGSPHVPKSGIPDAYGIFCQPSAILGC